MLFHATSHTFKFSWGIFSIFFHDSRWCIIHWVLVDLDCNKSLVCRHVDMSLRTLTHTEVASASVYAWIQRKWASMNHTPWWDLKQRIPWMKGALGFWKATRSSMVMRVMRISDAERGAICLLNVTAELHQRFTPVKRDTAGANIHSLGWTFPQLTLTFKDNLL